MKTRFCFILVSLVLTLSLAGCQRAANTTESPAVVAEECSPPKPAKPVPPKNAINLNWTESCSVEQAASAAKQVLEGLGLGNSGMPKTRTVTTRDPKTGKAISRRVPVGSYAKSDALSAVIETKSASGMGFRIEMLLQSSSPDTTQIIIRAISSNQPKDILQKQCKIIRDKISEAIRNPEVEPKPEDTAELLPYPETMTFHRPVDKVFWTIYNWASKEKFRHSGGGDDRYYRSAHCETTSRIEFDFQMRLVDDNKTQLEIKVSNYEGKDEFPLVLKGLMESLKELESDQTTSKTTTYAETKSLDHPISAVYNTLRSWAKENNFSVGRNAGGDAFYKYFSFNTASGIGFDFRMYMIGENETKLDMTATNQQDREEFPMILKSLEHVLGNIVEKQTVVEGAGQPTKAASSIPPKNSCESELK